MIRVGITGNMGSGKTLVCSIFEHFNIPVFYADAEAKLLYAQPDVKRKMRAYFGGSVFDWKNKIVFSAIAKSIFKDPEALAFVNQLLHPAVHQRYHEWLLLQEKHPYSLYEAAILFETGKNKDFDSIIFVSAPENVRVERIMQRDKSTFENIKSRFETQWPEERKIPYSNFVIFNDGHHMLLPQVVSIHKQLCTQSY